MIEDWVVKINKATGLNLSPEYIQRIVKENPEFHYIEYNNGFVLMEYRDSIYGVELAVISWYLEPFTITGFRKIQADINKLAKKLKCKYIKQYSHYNNKFNRWLSKQGYEPSEYKKEVV